MKDNIRKSKKQNEDSRGLFIPAGLFIGMGFGLIANQLIGGIFLGLGFGFLGIILTKRKKNK